MLSSTLALLGFLLVCFVVAATGSIFRPTEWYWQIDKPRWTPPTWVFPVVWTPLYIMIAVAGWLVWRRVGLAPLPFAFYAAQLVFNGAWSGLFFGMKRPDYAFADLIFLWLSIAATGIAFAGIDPVAGGLFIPYLVWVTIAGALNLSVWRRNRRTLALV